MPRYQHKGTINNSQCNISQPESSCPTTVESEYSNIAEAQEKDLETNHKKIIESLKEEMSEFLKEIQVNTTT